MRRSSGSFYQQHKESRPQSCMKSKKTTKKHRNVRNNSRISKYSTNSKKSNNRRKSETPRIINESNISTSSQTDSDRYLETLSLNFELFLCYKTLKVYVQKQIMTYFFKRWQHQFTSSILRHIKNNKKIRSNLSDAQFNYTANQLSFQNTKQFPAQNDTKYEYLPQYTDNIVQNQVHSPDYDHYMINQSTTHLNQHMESIHQIQESSNPNELANSVISPNSSILIASTSQNETRNKKSLDSSSSSLSIDKILDFSDYKSKSHITPETNQKDPAENFLQTITEFVSSDEFNSESLGQISIQKDKNKKISNLSFSPPHSPPRANKIIRNTDEDPLGSTLPTDLFTSSYSDLSQPTKSRKSSFVNDSSLLSDSPPRKKHQKPVSMDEERLIKAAIADEFDRFQRKRNPKQKDIAPKQTSPKNRKRRKIIIVREYSESDEYTYDERKDSIQDYYQNNNNDSSINDLYQPAPRIKRRNNTKNYNESPKKFTFSDESFSDNGNQDNQDQESQHFNSSGNQKPNDININHLKANPAKSNKSTQKKDTYNANIDHPDTNDKNESDISDQYSGGIDPGEIELKDIVPRRQKSRRDAQTEASPFRKMENASVNTMTNSSGRKRPFPYETAFLSRLGESGAAYKNNDSSDEIEYLLREDCSIGSGNIQKLKMEHKLNEKGNLFFSDDDSF